MKKGVLLIAVFSFLGIVFSCNKDTSNVGGGSVYLDLPTGSVAYFGAYSVGQDSNINKKATLGRVLFYDGHLSVNNAISCGSCHKQAFNFADNVALSTGFEGKFTKRNSLGLLNLAGADTFFRPLQITSTSIPLFWDGRENILLNLVDRPITNHVEMGIQNLDELPVKLSALSIYPPLFAKAYKDHQITSARISECIALFLASIQSNNSRFAQFNAGNHEVLTTLEQYGMNLFNGVYNCSSCHVINSTYGSVNSFHDIGLDQNYVDMGQGEVSGYSTDNGKFLAPNLHNIALTAPYMHDGRYKTLDDVLEHYSHTILGSPNLDTLLKAGSRPRSMNIPEQDKVALIAFLNTLTDYTTILDPKFSNPFKTR